MPSTLRVLLLADTHLGFDLPVRPRVDRPRRGPDFFANTERALEPALRGQVDLVVHGGDLLYRSKVSARLVSMAFEPLLKVADAGVPVVLVPGNHERSAIPYPVLAAHENLHILDRPSTLRLEVHGLSVAVAGFPCDRNSIRQQFPGLLAETAVLDTLADVRFLCLHQAVEGATVGPAGFVFRSGRDVIRGRDIPPGLAAVFAGHIHRSQTLTTDLGGRRLAAPVFYPGSIERTSFAERSEEKGFLILEVAGDTTGGRIIEKQFHRLPTRPLERLEIDATGLAEHDLAATIQNALSRFDAHAVVRVEVNGNVLEPARHIVSAAGLRALAPPTMIVASARR